MLKGKNLLILAGVAAVGYYLWKKNQSAKVISAPASVAFTGDLDVPAYQNANGDTTRKRVDTISGSSPFKHVVLKGNKPKQ